MNLASLCEASTTPSVEKISFREFKSLFKNKDGLVLMGAGGDLTEWIDGITTQLYEEGIAASGRPQEVWDGAYELTTSGGRTDLALGFHQDSKALNIGKLAMWRLSFGSASWISDYVVNYADQH